MKTVLGLALLVIGVAFGLYVGIWWAFIGGIIQIVEVLKAPEINSFSLAIGLLRVTSASLIGSVSAIVFVVPAINLLELND